MKRHRTKQSAAQGRDSPASSVRTGPPVRTSPPGPAPPVRTGPSASHLPGTPALPGSAPPGRTDPPGSPPARAAPLNHEHARLAAWFETVKFRKVLLGGVDEVQLWKKLEELNALFEAALSAERARYEGLLATYVAAVEGEKGVMQAGQGAVRERPGYP